MLTRAVPGRTTFAYAVRAAATARDGMRACRARACRGAVPVPPRASADAEVGGWSPRGSRVSGEIRAMTSP